jgi:hypothetical protein
MKTIAYLLLSLTLVATAAPAHAWTWSGVWSAITGGSVRSGVSNSYHNMVATPIYSKRGGKTVVIGWTYKNSGGVPDSYPYDNCTNSCN